MVTKSKWIIGEIQKCYGCGKYYKVWTEEEGACQFCSRECYAKHKKSSAKHDKQQEKGRQVANAKLPAVDMTKPFPEPLPPICKGTVTFQRKLYYETLDDSTSMAMRMERFGSRVDFASVSGKSYNYPHGHMPQLKFDEFGEPKEIFYPRTFTEQDRFKPKPSGYYYNIKVIGELPLNFNAVTQYADLEKSVKKLNKEYGQLKLETAKLNKTRRLATQKLNQKETIIEKSNVKLLTILGLLEGKLLKFGKDKALIKEIKEALK
jgi:hypothetical protein